MSLDRACEGAFKAKPKQNSYDYGIEELRRKDGGRRRGEDPLFILLFFSVFCWMELKKSLKAKVESLSKQPLLLLLLQSVTPQQQLLTTPSPLLHYPPSHLSAFIAFCFLIPPFSSILTFFVSPLSHAALSFPSIHLYCHHYPFFWSHLEDSGQLLIIKIFFQKTWIGKGCNNHNGHTSCKGSFYLSLDFDFLYDL